MFCAEFGGAADTMPTLISGLLLNTARVPLAVLFSARWGVDGVWYAIAGTTVMKAVIKQLAFRFSKLPACVEETGGGKGADSCVVY